MSTATYVRTRVDPEPFALALALGDAVAIAAFTTAGVIRHAGDPAGNPGHAAMVAAPFLIAWGLAAFLGGLYTRDAIATPRRALSWAIPAWVVATLLGQTLRATPVFPGGTELSFVLVTLGFGGALVVGWRVLAALAVDRLS